jgi:hypothetical protein
MHTRHHTYHRMNPGDSTCPAINLEPEQFPSMADVVTVDDDDDDEEDCRSANTLDL